MDSNISQMDVCIRFDVEFTQPLPKTTIRISLGVRAGAVPINGMRRAPEGDNNGWYIWGAEELSDDPEFFKPLRVEHVPRWCPEIDKYLALPPGWRFLLGAGEKEEIWYDETLLESGAPDTETGAG